MSTPRIEVGDFPRDLNAFAFTSPGVKSSAQTAKSNQIKPEEPDEFQIETDRCVVENESLLNDDNAEVNLSNTLKIQQAIGGINLLANQ